MKTKCYATIHELLNDSFLFNLRHTFNLQVKFTYIDVKFHELYLNESDQWQC